MTSCSLADLQKTLTPHVELSKTRLETLCLLVLGMISARTVNLTHIAAERSAPARVASTYRRLQRFFQQVLLPEDWCVGIVLGLIGNPKRWYLCMDRTNWKIGKSDVNILVLAAVTERYRVPLMWTFLGHSGNSTTKQRIALMQRYLALFDASSVRMFLADREFIGQEWFKYLKDNSIPFAIRVKEEQLVVVEGREYSLRTYLRRCKGERGFTATLPAKAGQPALELHFGAKRIKGGELLIVACSEHKPGKRILRYYSWRWFIECMFADCKTKGFNLEDTRLRVTQRLSMLVAIMAIAMAMACHVASRLMGTKYPARKKHGYCSKSWFRTGLDELRRRIRTGGSPLISGQKYAIRKRFRLGVA